MQQINSISDIPIEEYKISSNHHLLATEKELTVRMNSKCKYVVIHSDYKTPNKYILQQIMHDRGHLKHGYIEDGTILSLTAELHKGILTLKSKPKKGKEVSKAVSII